MAATAAAKVVPAFAQAVPDQQLAALPAGFNQYTQDYAQFCALPPEQQIYYMLSGGKIVQTRLDNATWRPTGMGNPPKLPIAGGSWDGVPMQSPISNLEGEGPYKPTWDS